MYGLSIDLIEKLSDPLQTGASAPNHNVTVKRGNKDTGYEEVPFKLEDITRISLKRQWNMAADSLEVTMSNVNGKYSPDYSPFKKYAHVEGLAHSGFKDVIKPYNYIDCELGAGNSLVRMFTGQIETIDIAEGPPVIKFSALNEYRKLLKPIDPIDTTELVYEGQTAFSIIEDLRKRAGIKTLVYDSDSLAGHDFTISRISFPIGHKYSDAIKELLTIMDHRATCSRTGELRIVKNVYYSQKDFHHVELDDYINLTDGLYKIDPSILRNRVIIMSENGWQAFEDPVLRDYMNGEIVSSAIDVKWAETQDQKWAVADHYFLTMRRRLRRIAVTVRGNPSLEIGDLAKVRMLNSTANGKYMIIAIQSDYSSSGYTDQVDLEYAVAGTGHIAEPAKGEYKKPEKPPKEEPEEETPSTGEAAVTMTLRDKIVDYAKSFLGKYYQWGGNWPDSGYGVDCSHFTYQALKKFGLMDGYRIARNQQAWCKPISRSELLPGDLVFYTWGTGVVKHVVMYIGNGQIIGANGGTSSTTSVKAARQINAKVKIQGIDYGRPSHYGRPPKLV